MTEKETLDPNRIYATVILSRYGVSDDMVTHIRQKLSEVGVDVNGQLLGGIVLHFFPSVGRCEAQNGAVYVNAYVFASAFGFDYGDVVKRQQNKKPLAVQKNFGGGDDLYISVSDLGHFFQREVTDDSLTAQIVRYQDTRDSGLLGSITEKIYPAVARIAESSYKKKFGGVKSLRVDDFLSAALEGFVDCIDRFDRTKGALFETYMQKRVRGSIIDYLRGIDSASRRTRQHQKYFDDEVESFYKTFGREPSLVELSKITQLPLDTLDDMLTSIRFARPINFENGVDVGRDSMASVEYIASLKRYKARNPDPLVEEELVDKINKTLEKFPKNVGKVLRLVLFDGMTMKEAGEEVGLSESRICQISTRYMPQLRQALDPHTHLREQKDVKEIVL